MQQRDQFQPGHSAPPPPPPPPPLNNNFPPHIINPNTNFPTNTPHGINPPVQNRTFNTNVPTGHQNFPNQNFPNQNFPTQPFPGQNFPNQPFPGQNFPSQPFPNQNFPNPNIGLNPPLAHNIPPYPVHNHPMGMIPPGYQPQHSQHHTSSTFPPPPPPPPPPPAAPIKPIPTSVDLATVDELKQQRDREERERNQVKKMESQTAELQQRESKRLELLEKAEKDKREKEARFAEAKAAKQRIEEEKKAKLEALRQQKLNKNSTSAQNSTQLTQSGSNLASTSRSASLQSDNMDGLSKGNDDREKSLAGLTTTQREKLFLSLISSTLESNNTKTSKMSNLTEWREVLPLIVMHSDYHSVTNAQRRKELFQILVNDEGYNISAHLCEEERLRVQQEALFDAQLSDQVFVGADRAVGVPYGDDNAVTLPHTISTIDGMPHGVATTTTTTATTAVSIGSMSSLATVSAPISYTAPIIPTECYEKTTTPKFTWFIDSLYYNFMQTRYKNMKKKLKKIEKGSENSIYQNQNQHGKISKIDLCPFCSITSTLSKQLKSSKITIFPHRSVSPSLPDKLMVTSPSLLCPYHHYISTITNKSSDNTFINNSGNNNNNNNNNNNITCDDVDNDDNITNNNIIEFLTTTTLTPKPSTLFSSLDLQIKYHTQIRSFILSLTFQFLLKLFSSFTGLCFTQQELSLYHIIGDSQPSTLTRSTPLSTPLNIHLSSTPHKRTYTIPSTLGTQTITVDTSRIYPQHGNGAETGQTNNTESTKKTNSVVSKGDYELLLSATCHSDMIPHLQHAYSGATVVALNTITTIMQMQQQFVIMSNTFSSLPLQTSSNQHMANTSSTQISSNQQNISNNQRFDHFQLVIDSLNQHQDHYKSLIYPSILHPQSKNEQFLNNNNQGLKNSQTLQNCHCHQKIITQSTSSPSLSSIRTSSSQTLPFCPPILTQMILSSIINENNKIDSVETRNIVINKIIHHPFFQNIAQNLLPEFALDAFFSTSSGQPYVSSRTQGFYSSQEPIQATSSLSGLSSNNTKPSQPLTLTPGQRVMSQVLQYLLPFIQAKLAFYIDTINTIRTNFTNLIAHQEKIKSFIHQRYLKHTNTTNKNTNTNDLSHSTTSSTVVDVKMIDSTIDDYSDDSDYESDPTNPSSKAPFAGANSPAEFSISILEQLVDDILKQIIKNTTTKAENITSKIVRLGTDGLPVSITDDDLLKIMDDSTVEMFQDDKTCTKTPYTSSLDNYFLHPHRLFQSLPCIDVNDSASSNLGVENTQVMTQNSTFVQPPWLSQFLSHRTSSLFLQGPQPQSDNDRRINARAHHFMTLPPFFPLSFLLFPPVSSLDTDISQPNNTFQLQYLSFPHSFGDDTRCKDNLNHDNDIIIQDIITNGPTPSYYCPCLRTFHTSSKILSDNNNIHLPNPHPLCLFQFFTSFISLSYNEYQSYRITTTRTSSSTNGSNNTIHNNTNIQQQQSILNYSDVNIPIGHQTIAKITPSDVLTQSITNKHVLPITTPNIYIDDSFAHNVSHYFFSPTIFTKFLSPQHQQQHQHHQQQQHPYHNEYNHAASFNQRHTFPPIMSVIAQLLDSTLDVMNAVVKQHIDAVRELYEPIYTKITQLYKNNENVSNSNFFTLFKSIHNDALIQRDLLSGSISIPSSTNDQPSKVLSTLPGIIQQSEQHTDVPIPPPLISTQAIKLLSQANLPSQLFIYHCIKHDVGMVRAQQSLLNERLDLSQLLLQCSEHVTLSYLTTKIKLAIKTITADSNIASAIIDGNTVTTVPMDKVFTLQDAISMLKPTFSQLPLCTCNDLNTLLNSDSSKNTLQSCPLTCLRGYALYSRQLLFAQLIYRILSGPI